MTEKEQPRIADEISKMEEEYEPLHPMEIKLIVWSISLGVFLLVVLTWVSYTFFPAP
jgi:predicted membrane protein